MCHTGDTVHHAYSADGPTCDPCGAGTEAKGDVTSQYCGACDTGTFSTDNGPCTPKSTCGVGQKVTDEGSTSTDRTCGDCRADEYQDNPEYTDPTCKACTVDDVEGGYTFTSVDQTSASGCRATSCAAGYRLLSDKSCKKCDDNQWSSAGNIKDKCTPCPSGSVANTENTACECPLKGNQQALSSIGRFGDGGAADYYQPCNEGVWGGGGGICSTHMEPQVHIVSAPVTDDEITEGAVTLALAEAPVYTGCRDPTVDTVSYTHLTLPTTPYV